MRGYTAFTNIKRWFSTPDQDGEAKGPFLASVWTVVPVDIPYHMDIGQEQAGHHWQSVQCCWRVPRLRNSQDQEQEDGEVATDCLQGTTRAGHAPKLLINTFPLL